MLDLAIIVPCYNEELTIYDTLLNLEKAINTFFANKECIIFVYNNNSKDNTVEQVNNFIKEKNVKNIKIVDAYIQGKGNVIKQAFSEIEANCYLMIDGDNTYSVSNVDKMFEAIIDKRADMVTGDRLSTSYFTENKRPFHNFGNRIVRFLVNTLYKTNYTDIMSGLRTFSYDFVKAFPITSDGFTLETEMNIYAATHNFKVLSFPVEYKDRIEGSHSKLNTIRDGFKVILKIFKMYKTYKSNTKIQISN